MDLSNATWQKSSYSGGNGGNCVDVARNLPGIIAIRDSKDRGGPSLIFPPSAFAELVTSIAAGELRRPAGPDRARGI